MTPNRPHVLISSPPALGHLRPICNLAAKLTSLRAIDVTLLLPNGPNTFALGSSEAARCLAAEGKVARGNLRVIAFSEPHSVSLERLVSAEKDAFALVWDALISAAPVKCSATGEEYPGLGKPSVVILSGMQFALFSIIRSTPSPPPIYDFQSSAAAGIAHFLLPPQFGGIPDDIAAPFNEDEKISGRPFSITGKVIKTPGLPDMYDHEIHPADTTFFLAKPGVFFYIGNLNMQAMVSCDGWITANSSAFDGEKTLASLSAWGASLDKPMFNVGPLRPFENGAKYSEKALATEVANVPGGFGVKVMTFLDTALKTHGKQTAIYISFGSMFWPVTNADHIWALLEILEERQIPFVLTHCSPFAKIPEHVQKRYGPDGEGKGLIVPFAPQQAVLAHPALGWFITHGGMGGTMDAISQGVPLIGWPFTGDQPSNIAYLVHSADVAFEFIESRTGPWATKPLLPSGKTPTCTLDAFKQEVNQVLDEAFGEVGARKRKNAQRMHSELAKAWSEGGSASVALEEFAARCKL